MEFEYQPKRRRRKAQSPSAASLLAIQAEKDGAAEERRIAALERQQLEAKRQELNDLAESIAKDALRLAAQGGLEIKTWADLERADKMGRRALGMGEDGTDKKVALNLTLLEGGMRNRTPPTIDA